MSADRLSPETEGVTVSNVRMGFNLTSCACQHHLAVASLNKRSGLAAVMES